MSAAVLAGVLAGLSIVVLVAIVAGLTVVVVLQLAVWKMARRAIERLDHSAPTHRRPRQ